MKDQSSLALDEAWRSDWGRLLGLLVGRFRDLDLAEESLADGFEAAARSWPKDGVPMNPAGWLLTAATRRGIDRLRAASTAQGKLPLLIAETSADSASQAPDWEAAYGVSDSELALLLLACHPALAPESQAALALRLVLGIPTSEIARLFLVSEPTMAARITRAKKKIATAGVPFAVPADDLLDGRVEIAARTIYLTFTAGYAPGDGDLVVRADLAGEAIRLARVLLTAASGRGVGGLQLRALLALMLLQHARRDARVDAAGELVLLADQDRSRWQHDEIAEALAVLQQIRPTDGWAEELRLQAVIAARHATPAEAAETDWSAIAHDYLGLERLTGSPVVRLNRAVAVAESDGPLAGLALLGGLDESLGHSHRLYAVRGELLARGGRRDDARAAITRAIELCRNDVELAHLHKRRADLGE